MIQPLAIVVVTLICSEHIGLIADSFSEANVFWGAIGERCDHCNAHTLTILLLELVGYLCYAFQRAGHGSLHSGCHGVLDDN